MTASRNRTITLTAEERNELQKALIKPSRLRQDELPLDKIIWGDTIQALQILPDEFADLVILDPPYNRTKQFGTLTFKSRHAKDYENYLDSWLPLVCQKLKPTGSLYLCGDWKCTALLQNALEKCQMHIINRITWQRDKGRGSAKNWKNNMEDIWFAVKNPQHYYFNADAVMMKRKVLAPYRNNGKPKDWQKTTEGNFRMTFPSNFWDDISIPFWSMPENTEHPTQKPEKLFAKLILASSKEGDLVFDPFIASGTTAVVAQKLTRHFCGIDQDKEYCLLAQKRLCMATENSEIQGYKDGVFWERNTLYTHKER